MTDVEQLQKDLEEIVETLKTLQPGSRAHRKMSDEKDAIEAELIGSGAIAQGDGAKAVGAGGTLVEGNVIVVKEGGRVVFGEQPVEMSSQLRETALGRYLEHVIAHNRYLQLQGIRSGGKLVNIELEQIYITLRTTQQRTVQAEEDWLEEEAHFAPGEIRRQPGLETVNVLVEQALAAHRHLVVLGDPGSGKTTLLRYLALLYGRDLAQGRGVVAAKLKLTERGVLPILLPLRQIGQFLRAYHAKDDGTGGHKLLLDFLLQSLKNHKLELPADFFDLYLEKGNALLLLDGLDEVADPELRARVARLVDDFTLAYPICRFVVTSRVVGYSGAARLGGDYVTTTVRDFTLADVEEFLKHWHRLVAIGQMGQGADAENHAASQTAQLLNAIQANERVRELAINPLMLTVIALVHRDRVKLPDRRAELYAEAVDVLLGKWDEARGVGEIAILDDRPFDAGDRRLLLQSIALTMHEREKKELDIVELRRLLMQAFNGMTPNEAATRRAVDRFLTVVEERTGLLAARGEGVYAFSHLTFQEYLAALAVAPRDDYVEFVLRHMDKAWWREVILLTAGHLSTQSKERTTRLIKEIAEHAREPEVFYNVVLAAECLRDVGSNRVFGKFDEKIQFYLKKELQRSAASATDKSVVFQRRFAAANALSRIGGQQFWKLPYGEPEWITIPAGEFWMGDERGGQDSKPVHKVYLPEYQISRVPVTNAQYALFVKIDHYRAPIEWEESRPPKGKESHPVVNVNWDDALAYCVWLSKITGKNISLPSEAEWEKAARGHQDKRIYPWGDNFDATRCNTDALGLGVTTPVGIFLEGASLYGLLDMSGNVWEWTRTIRNDSFKYPYKSDDGREYLKDRRSLRVLRGGAFNYLSDFAHCAFRLGDDPHLRLSHYGFRVVLLP